MTEKKINVMQVVLEISRAGLEMLVVELCSRLDRRKYNISILCFYGCTPEFKDKLKNEGIPVYVINRKGSFDITFFQKIIRLMKEQNIDIVHSNSGCFFNATICAYIARAKGIVFTAHGMPIETGIQAWIEDKIAAALSTKIVAVSDEIKDEMLRRFPSQKDKVLLLMNGVDTEQFSAEKNNEEIKSLKKLQNIPRNKKIIGTVGRLEKVKNYQMLIKSFAKLLEEGNEDLHLIFIGDGCERGALEKLVDDLDLEGSVSFIGEQADMEHLIPIIDIFVLSSLTEGTSVALLEAQSCGIPAVVTRVGGNERVIRDGYNGYLCEVHNVDEMSSKIGAFINNAGLMEVMKKNARSVVLDEFNIASMISSYENLYDMIINSNSTGDRHQ